MNNDSVGDAVTCKSLCNVTEGAEKSHCDGVPWWWKHKLQLYQRTFSVWSFSYIVNIL